ncbi:MAG: GNAT family N-acetyltransferase [Acidimicrobiia bacterium]|nr:GNAT family N-acetyltransferase [Acidimicrobiia bacterium]
MSRDGLADLNENWATWLDFTAGHAAGGESRTFGAIRCCSVGVPMPLFNQAFVFEKPSAHELAQATSWLAERNVPFWVSAPDSVAPEVADLAEPAGLHPTAATMPGMAFAPLSDLPADANGDAEILPVTQSAQLGDFALVASEAFEAPLEAAGTLAPASTLGDDRCSWFLGYLDGDLAACGQLLRTADVAGVYSVGVRERFRRRGLGAAITAAVLAAGRDSGCSMGVLQASPMGEPVYDRMGFETVTQYHCFAPSG